MKYLNFCICIGKQNDKVLVQVLPSDTVHGMWKMMEVSLDLHAAMEMRDGFHRRQLRTNDLKRLGEMLFEALLPPGMVRDLYQDSRVLAFSKGQGLRLRLHIASPELDTLPWELLHDTEEGRFLVLDPRFSVVRTPHVSGAKLPIKGEVRAFPLRLVGAFPSPVDLPHIDTHSEQAAIDSVVKKVGFTPVDVKREEIEAKEAVKGIHPDVSVVPVWLPSATLDDLVTNVPEAHVFHYGGHGVTGANYQQILSFNSEVKSVRNITPVWGITEQENYTLEPAYIFLEDDNHKSYPLSASKLALILRRSLVRVAVFMACDTALQSPTGESLPQFLMEAGLSAVVAMQTQVMDNITMKFGRYFYEALAAGLPIDDALSAARYITRVSFGDEYVDWATPVLYLAPDVDGLIFPERTADPNLEAARQRQPIIYVVQQIGTVAGGQVTGVEGLLREVVANAPADIRESLAEQLKQSPLPSQPDERRSDAETISEGSPKLDSPTETNHVNIGYNLSNPPELPLVPDHDEITSLKLQNGENKGFLADGTKNLHNDGSYMSKTVAPSSTFHKKKEIETMKYREMTVESFDFNRKLITEKKIWQISFKVRVLSSYAGEMSQEQAVPVEYNDGELQDMLKKVETNDLDQEGLVAIGRTLAALLLPPGPSGAKVSVRELLKDNLKGLKPDEGLQLRLRLPPMLAVLPWEYIYVDRSGGGDGMDGFLGLDPRVSIIRHEVLESPTTLEPLKGNIKIVIAMASTVGMSTLDLKKEQKDLDEAFSGQAGIVPQFLPDVTLDELLSAIPGTGIFHFAGHGAFERKMSDLPGIYTGEGTLALFDQMVPAGQLGINLRGNNVRLAVLGGCETGRREGVYVWGGIAPALVKADIPAVVGNQYKISDKCAIAFSRQFYRALVGGLPVERAVCAGRIAAYNADRASRDWGVPVLYLRTGDGHLFAGAEDDKVREAAKAEAEVNVNLRIGEVDAGGEVVGAQVGEMLSGKLAVKIVVSGTVYGTVIGNELDHLGGGSSSVKMNLKKVGPKGKVVGTKLKSTGGHI
jgi:CHAT domain-containing protein